MRLVIVGAGGHGQVMCDVALRAAERGSDARVVAFVDDRTELHGRKVLGVPVAGAIDSLARVPHDAVIVAIGENLMRKKITGMLRAAGEKFATLVHPSAVIAPDASIAEGVMVCAGAVVNTGTRVGSHSILNTGCTIDHHNTIDSFVHIAPGVHTGGDVFIGEGVLIGIGATVMPGRRIGHWAVVGAGSLVYSDVPLGTTVVGIPARPLVAIE